MSVIERVVEDRRTGMQGFLVIDSQHHNRSCGGLRIAPDATLEETRVLARAMTEKYALFGIAQTGGAKAGLRIPADTAPEQRARMLRAFGRAIAHELRSRAYIPWTDMGSFSEDIRTILEAAGAPVYDLEDTATPTAWSVFGSMLGVAEALGKRMDKCTAALEGFGNVGGALAQELARTGCKIIAVSTSDGAIYDPAGLDIPRLLELRKKHDSAFVRHTAYQRITQQGLLELPVTFLVPGARPHSIAARTRVRAQAIVPAANVPYAPGVVEALASSGTLCMPDIVTNAGGFVGSRLAKYGIDARAMVVRQWQKCASRLVRESAQAQVSPCTLVQHMVDVVRCNLQASSRARAVEHALRSAPMPGILRRTAGVIHARRCFARVHKRIREAAAFFEGMRPGKSDAHYAIVTAARNESQYIGHTLRSVVSQSVLPVRWVIVDDGSTDRTAEILADAARQYPWITVVTRPDRGYRNVGQGEAEAIMEGVAHLAGMQNDFIAKLDADMKLPPHYFAAMIGRFAANAGLGIASGAFWMLVNGRLVRQRVGTWTTAAHARVYRRECFEEIGGLAPVLGFDTIDEAKARMRGWMVQSFEDVRGIHLRPIASSTGAWWKGRAREGRTAYFCGTHPVHALARGVRLVFRHPRLSGGLGYLAGYFTSWFTRAPQYGEQDVRDFVRKRQLRRLAAFGS